jgi:hypothetical protein
MGFGDILMKKHLGVQSNHQKQALLIMFPMCPELLRPHRPPGGSNSRGASQKNVFEHLQPLALVQEHPTDWLKSDLIL